MMATTEEFSDENKMNISFIKSNKGQLLLLFNQYLYRCRKTTTKKKYWVCIHNGCTISIHTDLNNIYEHGGDSEHDHEPNPEMIAVRSVRQKMKERALNETVPTAMIYEEEITKECLNSMTVAVLPTSHEMNPILTKTRQKIQPLLPQSCLFDIPDHYKTNADGKRFLLVDETIVRRERLLMFASDQQLDLLFESKVIYIDGTFSKAPPHFTQIYTFHAILFDICIPCVFCLLVNKKAITYRQVFAELKEAAIQRGKVFSPTVVMSDFESGPIPVIKSEFPSSAHHGCYFHFTQAVYRQIQQLGLQQDYLNNDTIRISCKKLMALPLMPKDLVIDSFREIKADANRLHGQKLQGLFSYFEKQWMRDISFWNVSTLDARTNNICEGYHNRMKHRIYRNHPNIWLLIRFLQSEEKRVQHNIIQWSAGATNRKHQRTISIQHRLNTLLGRYESGTITSSDLLTGLSYVTAKTNK